MIRTMIFLATVALLTVGAASPLPAEETAQLLEQLELGDEMTPQQAEANRKLVEQLIDAVPQSVEQLVARLADSGDSRAQIALHTMVLTLGAPGRKKELEALTLVIAEQLAGDIPEGTKFFLIEQLQLTLGREAVPAIAAELDDPVLTGPAARALTQIGGTDAVAALRAALPATRGRPRMSIMQALTALGDRESLAEFRRTAADDDRDARLLALFCLADLGDGESADLILDSTKSSSRYERLQNFRAALRLAQRLGERGDAAGARVVYQEIVKRATGERESHVRQAATRGLLDLAKQN